MVLERHRVRKKFTDALLPILLTFGIVGTASACWVYWTGSDQRPDFIVVGSLSSLEESRFEVASESRMYGSKVMHLYNTGWVRVEEVLLGESMPDSIPVVWLADSRLEPPVGEIDVDISTERRFGLNDRKIWVVWPQKEASHAEWPPYRSFQSVEMGNLDKVRREISELDRSE